MNAEEYFEWLEEQFKDPLNLLAFEDVRPLEKFKMTMLHERIAASMSAREQFMYKLFLFTNNGKAAEDVDESWAAIAMSALHGDGKGTIKCDFKEPLEPYTRSRVEEACLRFYKPMPLNETFQHVQKFASELIKTQPEDPLAIWAEAQLNGRSGSSKASASKIDKSSIYTTEPTLYGLPLGRTANGEVVSYTGNRALVTIAPPDSGKSFSQAVPALNSFAGHVFVLDLKGQLLEQTAAKRRQAFDSQIINFNPRNPESSSYNPLQFISDDPDECWGEASILAQLIIPVVNTRDPSWETMAQRVLGLYLAYTALTEAPASRLMNRVLDLVAGIGTDEALDAMSDPEGIFPSAMQRVAHTVKTVRDPKSHAQYSGILQALEQNLSIWNDPRVERATKKCDWTPMDFRGSRTVSVYLTIPLDSIALYAPLIRVMTAQHVFQLMRGDPAANSTPILFLLDEFPQMGRMDPVRKAIEYGREYGIRTWLFAQFARQFEDTYGEVGKGIIDICGVRMYMNPSMKDAESISKEFGSRTGPVNEQKADNLPVDAIIGPENRDSVFALSGNEASLILKKNFPPR